MCPAPQLCICNGTSCGPGREPSVRPHIASSYSTASGAPCNYYCADLGKTLSATDTRFYTACTACCGRHIANSRQLGFPLDMDMCGRPAKLHLLPMSEGNACLQCIQEYPPKSMQFPLL